MERWSGGREKKKELHARRTLFKHVISHAFRPSPPSPLSNAPRPNQKKKKKNDGKLVALLFTFFSFFYRRERRSRRERTRIGYTGRYKAHVAINPEAKLTDQ